MIAYPGAGGAGRRALRFVDPQGAPWPGVDLVRFGSDEVLGTSVHDGRLELRLPAEPDARASKGSKGSAQSGVVEAAELRSEWTAVLLARRAGCARACAAACWAMGTASRVPASRSIVRSRADTGATTSRAGTTPRSCARSRATMPVASS